jgi:hypothetical protein
MATTNEELHRIFYEGVGISTPYRCTCGQAYAVSDDRRSCRLQHAAKNAKPAA